MTANFDVSAITPEILSTDHQQVVLKCATHKQVIEECGITPIHLTLGIVPTGVSPVIFKLIRNDFCKDANFESPLVALLQSDSTIGAIKTFLLTFGVSEEKVNRLPNEIVYNDFCAGRLGPALCADDLETIRNNLSANIDSLITMLDQFNPKVMEIANNSFKSITGSNQDLRSSLSLQQGLIPPSIIQYTRPPVFKRNDHYHPKQFDTPFFNYSNIMFGDLLPQIHDRLSKQSKTLPGPAGQPIYSPIIQLLQASGLGTTRIVIELGRLTNVMMIKCSPSDPAMDSRNRGLPESVVFKEIVEFIKSCKKEPIMVLVHKFHTILQRVLYMCSVANERRLIGQEVIMFDEPVDLFIKLSIYDNNAIGREMNGKPFDQQIKSLLFRGLEGDFGISKEQIKSFDSGKQTEYMEPFELNWIVPKPAMEKSITKFMDSRFKELRKMYPKEWNPHSRNLPKLFIAFDDSENLMRKYNPTARLEAIENSKTANYDMFELLKDTLRYFKFYWNESGCITMSSAMDTSRPSDILDSSWCSLTR